MLRPILFAIALVAPGFAAAQSTAPSVADHENWSVFTVAEPKQCFIASRAAETTVTRNGQPSTARRGEPVLHVTHTPGGSDDVVSAFFGFPPDPVQSIELRIGSDTFTLLAGKDSLSEWGWSQPGDDANAVSALRAGNVATVTTLSRTGKTIVDSYSLKGFTAALEDARARCAG